MNIENLKAFPELAPCGVYCGACPSFGISCNGCSSEKEQKRKSKWNCNLRTCCYTVKKYCFCIECDQFPCEEHRKKLLNSNAGDPRFKYKHDVIENFQNLTELGIENFLEDQNARWECPSCKGKIHWYYYKCNNCGNDFL